MKKNVFIFLLLCFLSFSCSQTASYRDGNIQYGKVSLTPEEKQIVTDALKGMHEKYDPAGKMLTNTING